MEDLETWIAFAVYVAALEARKRRKNGHLTSQLQWKRDVDALAHELAGRGVVL